MFLDLLLGDPRWLPHPVRLMGFFCNRIEAMTRKRISSEYLAGFVTVLLVLTLTLGSTAAILAAIYFCSPLMAIIVSVILLYTTIAMRDLAVHSRAVYNVLQDSESLESARLAVGRIVGRDTEALDRKAIIRACVETVAENMVDGVTAPLFYGVVCSLLAPLTGINPLFPALLGSMGYKAVNTMDSMFGYKNDTYVLFGRVAARLDDFVNFLPARLTGLLIVPVSFVLGFDWRNAIIVFKKDRLSHASPNAGHPEAAVAGALGVQLCGTSIYFGKEIVKPVIGKAIREIKDNDIILTNRLMLSVSFFFVFVLLLSRLAILQFFS